MHALTGLMLVPLCVKNISDSMPDLKPQLSGVISISQTLHHGLVVVTGNSRGD